MQRVNTSPHRHGLRVYQQHFIQALGLLLFQVVMRLLAFSPLIYSAATGKFFKMNPNYAQGLGLLFSLPLYVLLVMPFRFQAAARKAQLLGLRRDSRVNARNYLDWLGAALVRLLRALPYLLPFMVFAGLYYYYMPYPDFTVPMLGIPKIGALVGGDFLAGVVIIGIVGIVSALLAYCGWKRGLAFEHRDVLSLGIQEATRRAGALRKRRKHTLHKTIFINFLLCLPALIGVMAVLGGHLLSMKRMGMLALDYLQYATTILKMDFPASTLLMVGLVLLVLYIPLLPWRKLALAAVLTEDEEQL